MEPHRPATLDDYVPVVVRAVVQACQQRAEEWVFARPIAGRLRRPDGTLPPRRALFQVLEQAARRGLIEVDQADPDPLAWRYRPLGDPLARLRVERESSRASSGPHRNTSKIQFRPRRTIPPPVESRSPRSPAVPDLPKAGQDAEEPSEQTDGGTPLSERGAQLLAYLREAARRDVAAGSDRYVGERTLADIEAALGWTPTTIRRAVAWARKRSRRLYKARPRELAPVKPKALGRVPADLHAHAGGAA
jgi:hypothetical protein